MASDIHTAIIGIAMSNPAVSVCVPTYNGMPYLPLTIRSALAQTLTDFELIIVDDASTDSTADYLATLNDPRIRIERNPTNLGAAATWTRAIDLAAAPYVKLLCQDDLLDPTCLAEQSQMLEKTPAAILCTCWREVINARGDALMTRRGLWRSKTFLPGDRVVRSMVTRGANLIGEPSAVLFRRSAWAAVRPYSGDNFYMIDVSLWAKLLRIGGAAAVPKRLCSFRISTTSLSAQLSRQQGHDARRFFRLIAVEHRVARWRLRVGLLRATLSAFARQFIFARQRR